MLFWQVQFSQLQFWQVICIGGVGLVLVIMAYLLLRKITTPKTEDLLEQLPFLDEVVQDILRQAKTEEEKAEIIRLVQSGMLGQPEVFEPVAEAGSEEEITMQEEGIVPQEIPFETDEASFESEEEMDVTQLLKEATELILEAQGEACLPESNEPPEE
ncbi:MAG: hypothetical protein FWF85_04320 [Clostridiales bacterium]|jgi:hypothetical protein|nr:hypothetical protein [Clostridiales bacterium]MDR2713559.1 hypothetical protein [Clostridiales bacterium]